MLFSATLMTVMLGVVVHRTWLLSGFMQDRAKSGQIFLLTIVSGFCLITNVIAPFLVVAVVITILEIRALFTEA